MDGAVGITLRRSEKNLLRNIVGNILGTAFLSVLLCFTCYDMKQISEMEHDDPFSTNLPILVKICEIEPFNTVNIAFASTKKIKMFARFISLLALAFWGMAQAGMPLPFTRELYVTSPVMTGNDVLIAQTLLQRDSAVSKSFVASGDYAKDSAAATSAFQEAHNLPSTGTLDSVSAQLLLDLHSDDGYTDSGFTAASMGYLYKFHIPVHTNRSIETYATLFDKDNNVLLKFKARTHGHRADGTDTPWPDYGNNDIGLTQFYSSGTFF